MIDRFLLNLVGLGAADAEADIDDPRILKGRVALFNPTEVSADAPCADLLASPASFASMKATHEAQAVAAAGLSWKVGQYPDAEIAVADYEAVLPVPHNRTMETAWTGALGATAGVREYSRALRWTFDVFRREVNRLYRAAGSPGVACGMYGSQQCIIQAFNHTVGSHALLAGTHRRMYRPGGPYAWLERDVPAKCYSYYVPAPAETYDAQVPAWIAGAGPLQRETQLAHRTGGVKGMPARGTHHYAYLGLARPNSGDILTQAAIAHVVEALHELPYTVTPVLWASVPEGENKAHSDSITDHWVPAMDAVGVAEPAEV